MAGGIRRKCRGAIASKLQGASMAINLYDLSVVRAALSGGTLAVRGKTLDMIGCRKVGQALASLLHAGDECKIQDHPFVS